MKPYSLRIAAVCFLLLITTAYLEAQGNASVDGPIFSPLNDYEYSIRFDLRGFAPNSQITVTNTYSSTDCRTGTPINRSWTDTQGPTDGAGNLVIAYRHGDYGTYNFTFTDNQGNTVPKTVTVGTDKFSGICAGQGVEPTPVPPPTQAPQNPPPSNPQQPLPTCSVQSFNISPTSGSRGTEFTLSGRGDCNTGVRAIRFKIDGGIIYELGSPEITRVWNSSGASEGTHTATIEVAGHNDNDWRAAATRSVQFTVGSGGSAPVQPQQPAPSQPQPANNNWRIGSTVYLCQGTQIRNGSGLQYGVHTVVPVNAWSVTVINGPRQVDGYAWWDIRRDDGGSGWVRQDQANCQPTSGNTNPSNPLPDNIPIDNGSSSPVGNWSLQVHASPYLNIRSGPGTSFQRIGKAADGSYFEIINGPQNGWYQIRFRGGEGWVSGEYVSVFSDNDTALSTSRVPFSREGYSFDFIVSISPHENRCYLENGSELIVREIAWFDRQLRERQLLRPRWWGYAIMYFLENTGGSEELRHEVENRVVSFIPGCVGRELRYRVGNHNIDTSGLGNIAFGYFMNNPLLPGYLRDGFAEEEISNLAQALNVETRARIIERCGGLLNLQCIVDNILLQADNSDDVKQRQVGRNLQVLVRNGSNLSVRTLERVADIFGFF